MFGWKKKPNRNIYRFWDGTRERGIDPVRALREMYADKEFVPEKHYDAAVEGDLEATAVTLRMVHRVFGLQPYRETDSSEVGLTDQESLEVLFGLAEYLETLKKNGNGQQTLPDVTEPPPLGASTTRGKLDSGSTSTEPKHAEPLECSAP
jgi:broad specificity phosphatase PhoE